MSFEDSIKYLKEYPPEAQRRYWQAANREFKVSKSESSVVRSGWNAVTKHGYQSPPLNPTYAQSWIQ